MSLGRGIDSTVLSDMESERNVALVNFLKYELDSGTVYLHDSVGTFTWADPIDGSQDWLGIGDFGGISAIEENYRLSAYEIELRLSGLDDDWMDEILNQNYSGRTVTIYLGGIDVTTMTLKGTPNEIWRGKSDVGRVTLGAGESNYLTITCENDFAILDKINGSLFSDADIQNEFSGDLFFQYLPAMIDARIVWRGNGRTGFSDQKPSIDNIPFDFDGFRGI